MATRRRFGAVRRLPSGRWQASYRAPDGSRRTAPATFATKTDADRWVSAVETDLLRGTWIDDAAARVAFADYATDWLASHPRIGPRWRETCERNLRLHLAPLAPLALRDLTPSVVRHWYAEATAGGGGRTSIAQSYRLLRAVLNSAVADGALARNPCQIRGAGVDRAVERPVATPAEIAALVEAITPRYRAAVVLAAWCGLRRGEVLALNRADLDLERGLVTVRHTRTELLSAPDASTRHPRPTPATGWLRFRRMCCRCSPSTSPPTPAQSAFSSAPTASRCAGTRSAWPSSGHGITSAFLICASTTFGTPGRHSPQKPGRALPT